MKKMAHSATNSQTEDGSTQGKMTLYSFLLFAACLLDTTRCSST